MPLLCTPRGTSTSALRCSLSMFIAGQGVKDQTAKRQGQKTGRNLVKGFIKQLFQKLLQTRGLEHRFT